MRKTVPVLTALWILLFLPSAVLSQTKTIRKEADYRALVVGKTVVYDDGARLVVNADGTITGTTAAQEKIVGAWNWQRRFFCRNVTIGDVRLAPDCQVVEVDGNKFRVIRDRGRAEASAWATLE